MFCVGRANVFAPAIATIHPSNSVRVNNVSTPTSVWGVDGTGTMTAAGFKISGTQVIGAQASAIADVASTNVVGDGDIAGLTVSDPPAGTEVTAIGAKLEKLRDLLNEERTALNAILAGLRGHGLLAT